MYQAVIDAFNQLEEEGKDPNFIFMGGSLIHAISFNAFIEKMRQKGTRMCGVACDVNSKPRKKQFNGSYLTSLAEEDFIFLNAEEDFDYLHSKTEFRKEEFAAFKAKFKPGDKAKKSDKVLYLIFQANLEPTPALWETVYRLRRNIVLVHLEEGVAPYAVDYYKPLIPTEKNKILRGMHYVWRILRSSAYNKKRSLMHRGIGELKNLLLNQLPNGELQNNTENIALFNSAMIDLAKVQGVPKLNYENTVIIVGTELFEEYGLEEFELKYIGVLVDIIQRNGFKVIIRPHPRLVQSNTYNQFDVEIDQNTNVPLECLLAMATVRPVATIGPMSSSQVFGASLFDVPAISISKLLANGLEPGLCEEFLKQIGTFIKSEQVFKGIVSPANDLKDVDTILKGIRQ